MARQIVSFAYDDGTVVRVTSKMQVIVDDAENGKIITQDAGDTVKIIDRGNTFMRLRKLDAIVKEALS